MRSLLTQIRFPTDGPPTSSPGIDRGRIALATLLFATATLSSLLLQIHPSKSFEKSGAHRSTPDLWILISPRSAQSNDDRMPNNENPAIPVERDQALCESWPFRAGRDFCVRRRRWFRRGSPVAFAVPASVLVRRAASAGASMQFPCCVPAV